MRHLTNYGLGFFFVVLLLSSSLSPAQVNQPGIVNAGNPGGGPWAAMPVAESFTSGMVWHPSGGAALVWSSDGVFLKANGVPWATEITFRDNSIERVQGITCHPLGNEALIWTRENVYRLDNGASSANVVTLDAEPLWNVKGVIYNPQGSSAFIWSPDYVALKQTGSIDARVISREGRQVEGTQGIAFHPLGTSAFIWTPEEVLLYSHPNGFARELTFAGDPINQAQGVAYHPLGATAIIWTPGKVFRLANGATVLEEVTIEGNPVSRARGVAWHPLGASALVWTPSDVLLLVNGISEALEVIIEDDLTGSFEGDPVSRVRGVAWHPRGAAALIWTPGNVFRYLVGTTWVSEVANEDPTIANPTIEDLALDSVRGISWHPVGEGALLWTSGNIFRYLNGTLMAREVKTADPRTGRFLGESLSSVRGVAYHPLGATAVIWTPGRAFLHLNGQFRAYEITTPDPDVTRDDLSLNNVQGAIYHPLGGYTLIMTASNVYLYSNGSRAFSANEVMARDRFDDGLYPIFSFDDSWARWVHAIVHHTRFPEGVIFEGGLPVEPGDGRDVGNIPEGRPGREPGVEPGNNPDPHHGRVVLGKSTAGHTGSRPITPVTFSGTSPAMAELDWSSRAAHGHFTTVGASSFANATLILGPDPVGGVLSGNSMKVVGNYRPFFRRGDSNQDGRVDMSDGVKILRGLFILPEENSCGATEDTNNDGVVDMSDAVIIFSFLFSGGPAPASPGPFNCGQGRGADRETGCEEYSVCD